MFGWNFPSKDRALLGKLEMSLCIVSHYEKHLILLGEGLYSFVGCVPSIAYSPMASKCVSEACAHK